MPFMKSEIEITGQDAIKNDDNLNYLCKVWTKLLKITQRELEKSRTRHDWKYFQVYMAPWLIITGFELDD
jgi:hypothetical protein